MKVEEIIFSILSSDSDIAGIVSDNIFPLRAAQGKQVPFITYISTNIEPNSGKNEKSVHDTYLIDIDIFSDGFAQIATLVDLVRNCFEAVTFTSESILCDFDFLTIKEDYKNDAQLYNKTVSIIAHYKK
ncbi:DUF3168 domain-containing protein [Belliella sp. DSM 111904]|uniref:DUF3168 domain-containing protein n=1 Tax=Belliella filtrata TaxID=2923435 RepID=A0ABS9V419_9BACT|nr:DUF3168 domain-containing protein [Belliella filtrata]MCH7411155.1 DUF3168 domain-containing protein [Belliella filtrata]